jgi:MFS family permease
VRKNITKSAAYPWLLVLFYSLLGMTCPAAVTQYSMVANNISADFGGASQLILLADSVRAVVLVLAMFLSGIFYKKIGLRRTILLGVIFQSGSQLLVPFAIALKSIPLLFVFKCMQGLNAIAFPLYISAITMWISDRYKGLATAIFNGAFIAGGGVGSFITSRIMLHFDYKASFFVLSGLCILFAIPSLLLTRDKNTAPVCRKQTAFGEYHAILSRSVTWLLVLSLVANTWVSQAVNVDMSVYAQDIGFDYGLTGNLMLLISAITVVASILAGGVSDRIAEKLKSPVKSRCHIMALGYLLSVVSAALLPSGQDSFSATAVLASLMMFGVSWSAGVFWAIPSELFSDAENVVVTSFCSSASNVPNPIAPTVVGVLLGSCGLWNIGWYTCAAASLLSMLASVLIVRKAPKNKQS